MSSMSTWRVLGLSTAGLFTGLGMLTYLKPSFTASEFLGKEAVVPGPSLGALEDSFVLFAARDLTIGATLFIFDYYHKPESMGLLVLGCMPVYVIDVWMMYKNQGLQKASTLGAGAAILTYIGYALAFAKGT